MKRTTHMLSGVAIGALVASLLGEEPLGLMLLGGLFGTVPDLDMVVARMGLDVHRSPASHSLLAAVLLSVGWAVALASAGDVLDEAGAGIPLWPSAAVVLLSVFLHAAEDSVTRAGCRLLFPLSRRVFRGPVRYDDVVANASLSALALLVLLISLTNDLSKLLP